MAYKANALSGFFCKLANGAWAKCQVPDDFHPNRATEQGQDSCEIALIDGFPPANAIRRRIHWFLPTRFLERGPENLNMQGRPNGILP